MAPLRGATAECTPLGGAGVSTQLRVVLGLCAAQRRLEASGQHEFPTIRSSLSHLSTRLGQLIYFRHCKAPVPGSAFFAARGLLLTAVRRLPAPFRDFQDGLSSSSNFSTGLLQISIGPECPFPSSASLPLGAWRPHLYSGVRIGEAAHPGPSR